jgi:hypothetical protein
MSRVLERKEKKKTKERTKQKQVGLGGHRHGDPSQTLNKSVRPPASREESIPDKEAE